MAEDDNNSYSMDEDLGPLAKRFFNKKVLPPDRDLSHVRTILPPYEGDKFGGNCLDNADGLMYMSRMKTRAPVIMTLGSGHFGKSDSQSSDSYDRRRKYGDNDEQNEMRKKQIEKDQRQAVSLATLSTKDEKRRMMIENGAVPLLVSLARNMHAARSQDRQTQVSTASAFNNLAWLDSHRWEYFIKAPGTVAAICQLCQYSHDRKVKQDCAQALLNLSAIQHGENDIVNEGAGAALPNMIQSSTLLGKKYCLMAIMNLTCVEKKYVQIHQMNECVLHWAQNYQTVGNPRLVTFILKALCNLTGVKNNQANLVEQTCARTIAKIAMSHRPKKCSLEDKIICVKALCNLTEDTHSRSKMVDPGQNVVSCLINLSKDNRENDHSIKHYCLLSLGRMAVDLNCTEKMTKSNDKLLEIFVTLCRTKFDDLDVQRVASAALTAMAMVNEATATKMVQVGAVSALRALMEQRDLTTQRYCVKCLCILTAYGTSIKKIVEAGTIGALVLMAESPDGESGQWCALSFMLLSRHGTDLDQQNNRDIVGALVRLCEVQQSETKTDCAQALHNLTNRKDCDASMLIPSLVRMLKGAGGDAQIRGECAAALFNLAGSEDNCDFMLREGVLPPVLELCHLDKNSGPSLKKAKQSCAAILSELSQHTSLWGEVTLNMFVEALLHLAEDDKDQYSPTSLLVSIALFNLSWDETTRPRLISRQVVEGVVKLANRPDEYVRQTCAAIFVNLSSVEGSEMRIINAGAVDQLLVLALVQSDTTEVKEFCARALFNLLYCPGGDNSHHKSLVGKKVIHGFAKLAIEDDLDEEIPLICAIAFCLLSVEYYKEMSSSSCINPMFELLNKNNKKTQIVALNAIANLLAKSEASDVYLHKKAIRMLQILLVSSERDPHVMEMMIIIMSVLSKFEHNCKYLIQPFDSTREEDASDLVQVERVEPDHVGLLFAVDVNAIMYMQSKNADVDLKTAYALAMYRVAECSDTRTRLLDSNSVMEAISRLTEADDTVVTALLVRTISSLASEKENLKKLVDRDVCGIMYEILQHRDPGRDNTDIFMSFILLAYNLSCEDDVRTKLVNVGLVGNIMMMWDSLREQGLCESRTTERCALAICNLACGKVNSARVVRDGATRVLYEFTKETTNVDYCNRCASAIRNLMCIHNNHNRMVKDGVIESIKAIHATTKDPLVMANCGASLRNLMYHPDTRDLVLEAGAISVILEGQEDANGDASGLFNLGVSEKLQEELEHESWCNDSRETARDGRAPPLDALPPVEQTKDIGVPLPTVTPATYRVDEMVKKLTQDPGDDPSDWLPVAQRRANGKIKGEKHVSGMEALHRVQQRLRVSWEQSKQVLDIKAEPMLYKKESANPKLCDDDEHAMKERKSYNETDNHLELDLSETAQQLAAEMEAAASTPTLNGSSSEPLIGTSVSYESPSEVRLPIINNPNNPHSIRRQNSNKKPKRRGSQLSRQRSLSDVMNTNKPATVDDLLATYEGKTNSPGK